jgi:hypothetical protein
MVPVTAAALAVVAVAAAVVAAASEQFQTSVRVYEAVALQTQNQQHKYSSIYDRKRQLA